MKHKTSQSPSIRPYGQRSIVSNFSPQAQGKKMIGASPVSTSSLSLLEFLDRKLDKSSQNTLQEKSSSSESAIPKVLSGGACDGKPSSSGIAETKLFEQLKHSSKDPQQATTQSPLQDPNNKRDSLKRKSFSSPDIFQQSSGSLLVLGMIPSQRGGYECRKGWMKGRKPSSIIMLMVVVGGTQTWWDLIVMKLDPQKYGRAWDQLPSKAYRRSLSPLSM